MMTVESLAERWGVSIPDAKRIVREEKVPFVELRASDMNLRWRFVRFEPDAVAQWEAGRRRFVAPAPDVAAPAKVPVRRLRLRS